jgi:hypothetical protein
VGEVQALTDDRGSRIRPSNGDGAVCQVWIGEWVGSGLGPSAEVTHLDPSPDCVVLPAALRGGQIFLREHRADGAVAK